MNNASRSSLRKVHVYHEVIFYTLKKVINIISKAAIIILVSNDYGHNLIIFTVSNTI